LLIVSVSCHFPLSVRVETDFDRFFIFFIIFMRVFARLLSGRPVYLDAQATTPMDPRVLDAMMPYMTSIFFFFFFSFVRFLKRLLADLFGNPHSKTHSYGWETEKAVETARESVRRKKKKKKEKKEKKRKKLSDFAKVAKLIGASSKEIVFTSGATESNNLAIRGVADFYKSRRNHIVTVVTEHKCVLDSCRHLEHQERSLTDKTPAFQVTYLPVSKKVRFLFGSDLAVVQISV
jgi:cysteine desulfurase